MKIRLYIMLPVFGLVLSGCSEEPRAGDNWYEESRTHTEQRDDYVETMQKMGISEKDARAKADLDYYIENTIRPPDTKVSERDF